MDTQSELRWKSKGCFIMSAGLTIGAVPLCLVQLPPAQHGNLRAFLVCTALCLAVVVTLIGVWERHAVATAPVADPHAAQKEAVGKAMMFGQAVLWAAIGLGLLAVGTTGVGAAGLVAAALFAAAGLLIRRGQN